MPDPWQPPPIRAGDDDRERTLVVLRDAVVGGRLTLEEFSDRVGLAQTARTERELAALTADLPSTRVESADLPPVKHSAVCSHLVRRGPWELPVRSHWTSVCGTIDLDLRDAKLEGPETELSVFNLCGTVNVLVPPGVEVAVDGGGWFASQVIEPPARRPPSGAPRLRIRARGPGGTLYVRCVPPRRGLARMLDRLLGDIG
jgi:uncharacterized protein YjiS (DUF1127 family)